MDLIRRMIWSDMFPVLERFLKKELTLLRAMLFPPFLFEGGGWNGRVEPPPTPQGKGT